MPPPEKSKIPTSGSVRLLAVERRAAYGTMRWAFVLGLALAVAMADDDSTDDDRDWEITLEVMPTV